MLRLGLTGLPRCGKTSLFRALTGVVAGVDGGGKRELHLGQVKVPDARLDELTRIFQRSRKVQAIIEYVDVVGFSAGEARKASFEDQFLGDLRTCDALLHVLRAFDQPGLPPFDPVRDFQIAEQEFILSDQIILEKRLTRVKRDFAKLPNKTEATREIHLLEHCLEALNRAEPLRRLDLSKEDEPLLRAYQPLSLKPQLAVLNVAESDVLREEEILRMDRPQIGGKGVELGAACASLEMEIAQLEEASKREFMDDLGISESALERMVHASFHLLGLISFFTVVHDECRAWTIQRGARAKEAAGAVHTDMERGFIRAEVVNYRDFQPRGSFAACRHDGVLRLEGKEYIVQDGDIIEFRFAV